MAHSSADGTYDVSNINVEEKTDMQEEGEVNVKTEMVIVGEEEVCRDIKDEEGIHTEEEEDEDIDTKEKEDINVKEDMEQANQEQQQQQQFHIDLEQLGDLYHLDQAQLNEIQQLCHEAQQELLVQFQRVLDLQRMTDDHISGQHYEQQRPVATYNLYENGYIEPVPAWLPTRPIRGGSSGGGDGAGGSGASGSCMAYRH